MCIKTKEKESDTLRECQGICHGYNKVYVWRCNSQGRGGKCEWSVYDKLRHQHTASPSVLCSRLWISCPPIDEFLPSKSIIFKPDFSETLVIWEILPTLHVQRYNHHLWKSCLFSCTPNLNEWSHKSSSDEG